MHSPFAAHLGTNYCPKDEELLKLNAFLVEPSYQLKRLRDEIAELHKTLHKLEEEHHSLLAHVDAHKALLSPVRRLPLDVIQEIFIACMPTHRNCVMSALEAPVLLGRICRSWREISLSTPRLWSRLHIAEPQRDYGPYQPILVPIQKLAQRFENIKMWLGRSGECPLSISLHSDPNNGLPLDLSSPPPFVQALLPFASRWQHIHFTTSPVTLDAISHLTESDVPLLETVRFAHDHRLLAQSVGLEQFGMLRSPLISSFSAWENDFGRNLPLPWHRLTTLEMTGLTWECSITSEKIVQILSQCPELRVCKLVVKDEGSVTGSSPLAVELKYLHTLRVTCQSVDLFITRLLDRLSLPKLQSFNLRGSSDGEHPPSLAPALACWTELEDLEIDSDGFSKLSLLECLRGLPGTMQRLVIHDMTNSGLHNNALDDDAVTLLTPTSGHYLCPTLEILEMTNCRWISDATLLQFITLRMESRHKLKRIQINFNRDMTLDVRSALEPFMKNGLDISVSHNQPFPVYFSPWQGLSDAPGPTFSGRFGS
ncbi:hypothetical protein B0H16DRAFT_1032256 [Mycena metata]|uniref:F-box domain-containing protein n=1 Tax=Mycena metata TaxID=1033252 RepID=A0AAD7N157_9AGAR|nr:hypothetical protein B0H16DRAFT_1032256 [Mycena metata]